MSMRRPFRDSQRMVGGMHIHLTVEVYDPTTSAWVWERVAPEALRDPRMGAAVRTTNNAASVLWRGWEQSWYPTDDDYDLFQRLAAVRGIGGSNITLPRGLPLNLSDGLRKSNVDLIKRLGWELTEEELGIWVALQMLRQDHVAQEEIYREEGDFSLGDHYHSYLLLSELLFQPQTNGSVTRRDWSKHPQFATLLWTLECMTKDPRTGDPLKHPNTSDIRIVFGFIA